MRVRIIVCYIIAFGAASELFGQSVTRQDTQRLALALQTGNISTRQLALENFANKVKHTLGPGTKPLPADVVSAINDAMPVLGQALGDPDAEVRKSALRPLVYVAIREQAAIRGADPSQPDLTREQSIKNNLIKLMSDPDGGMVRAPATSIYAWSFKPTPELEQKWMSNFVTADQNERQAIMEALLAGGSPSPQALQFVLAKLRDPVVAPETASTIVACLKPPPPEALAIMVQEFANSGNQYNRSLLAQVIPKFGDTGKQYLPILREMRARETDAIAKSNLENAISQISAEPAKAVTSPITPSPAKP